MAFFQRSAAAPAPSGVVSRVPGGYGQERQLQAQGEHGDLLLLSHCSPAALWPPLKVVPNFLSQVRLFCAISLHAGCIMLSGLITDL